MTSHPTDPRIGGRALTLNLRYTAASDVGMLREENEDSAYAGAHLVAVADGVGGNVHGEVASAVAIATLASLDKSLPADELAGCLRTAVQEIDQALQQMVDSDSSLEGMSTTLTALLFSDGRCCLGHIGDSRAYLVRDGMLRQVSRDHSLVQTLVDEGKITQEQAAVHPQRSVILQALNGRGSARADIDLSDAEAGDRWLLCSDGLSDYVSGDAILETVTGSADLDAMAARLISLANAAGGPDNITCVLADVVDDAAQDTPLTVGAAAFPAPAQAADEPTSPLRRRWWQSLLGDRTARVDGSAPPSATTDDENPTPAPDTHR
ncbi:MAG: serine/threonine-protein phosphatase [Streptosporangiales bacterium]|nr:serine/threonine-protein phosphatase [Streptosporangiales bacterium]